MLCEILCLHHSIIPNQEGTMNVSFKLQYILFGGGKGRGGKIYISYSLHNVSKRTQAISEAKNIK